MGEEELDLGLGKPVERPSLGMMFRMNSWFLSHAALSVERYGLVKNALASPFLDLVEPGELGPVVAQASLEGGGVIGPKELSQEGQL